MLTRSAQREPIDPRLDYPIAAFKRLAGVGDAWLRSARRDGLRVVYAHGRGFIRGCDFCSYIDGIAEREQNGPALQHSASTHDRVPSGLT